MDTSLAIAGALISSGLTIGKIHGGNAVVFMMTPEDNRAPPVVVVTDSADEVRRIITKLEDFIKRGVVK